MRTTVNNAVLYTWNSLRVNLRLLTTNNTRKAKTKQNTRMLLLFTPQDVGQYHSRAETLRVSDGLPGLGKQKEREKEKATGKKEIQNNRGSQDAKGQPLEKRKPRGCELDLLCTISPPRHLPVHGWNVPGNVYKPDKT